MDRTFENIGKMLEAGYPLLYLATSEYNRTTQKLRAIAFEQGLHFHTWDTVDGLRTHARDRNNVLTVTKHNDHGDTRGYQELLEFIKHRSISNSESSKEIYVVEDFHKNFRDEKVLVYLRKLSEAMKTSNSHFVMLSPFMKLPDELEKFVTIVSIPLPDRKDLNIRLSNIPGAESCHADLKKFIIDAAMGLTDMEADLAFRLARVKVGLNNKEAANVISREKEQIIKKSAILDFYDVDSSLTESVGGLDKLKSWLDTRKLSFERAAKKYGLKEPRGILLLGVPGCGKSLTAKCVATEWEQPLLRLDIGKIFQAEVGSSEHNIRRALATAEAVAPCVLWIDEIEKGLSTGGGEKDGGTNSRVFSTILTWMQEKTHPVFVVATANNISELPPELLRKGRFDEIFFVDLPTHSEREKIFRIHLKKHGQESVKALKKLAERTRHFNGAEIEEAVREAMFLSYVDHKGEKPISIRHLEIAIDEIVPLAHTMKNKIEGLRNWARSRARPASSENNTESLENHLENNAGPDYESTLTMIERKEDIF